MRKAHRLGPWKSKGRQVLNSRGQVIAEASHMADARRISAAINSVEGIPTLLLENGFVASILRRHTERLLEEGRELAKLLDLEPQR